MLRTRLWMGALLITGLAAGLWIDEQLGPTFPPHIPPYPCWMVISLLAVIGCCRELRQLTRRLDIRTGRWLTYGSLVAITLANWVPFLKSKAQPLEHLAWAFLAVIAANMLILIREAAVFRQPGRSVITASGGMFTTFYLGGLAAFLIELRWVNDGLLALSATVAAAKCGDTGAYFGGRALGRHKLCPSLSPNKTVEGAIAGLIASVIGVVAVLAIGAMLSSGGRAMAWWAGIFFGLSVGAMAMVGDLVESLIKRDCEQKDASALVPGFGGLLDVLDSPLFSAPLAYGLWTWLGP